MSETNINQIKKIHQFFLYTLFAIMGFILISALLAASDIYRFPFDKMEPAIIAILILSGVPSLLLGGFLLLAGSPVAHYALKNPFPTMERLNAHFQVKLDDRHYGDTEVLAEDESLKLSIRRKKVMGKTRIFAIGFAPLLTPASAQRMQDLLSRWTRESGGKEEDVSLSLALCVDRDSQEYDDIVKGDGRGMQAVVVPVGFDFGKGILSFQGKIDGLAGGPRKRVLRGFLSMLPVPQNYLDTKVLQGGPRKTYTRVAWRFNPEKVPKGIHLLWSASGFLLAVMSLVTGTILAGNNWMVLAVILFIFAFFLIGMGIFQLKQAMASSPDPTRGGGAK